MLPKEFSMKRKFLVLWKSQKQLDLLLSYQLGENSTPTSNPIPIPMKPLEALAAVGRAFADEDYLSSITDPFITRRI